MAIIVEVTALRAPWPNGISVGSRVKLEVDSIPPWAVGKCKLVNDAQVELIVATPEPSTPEPSTPAPAAKK